MKTIEKYAKGGTNFCRRRLKKSKCTQNYVVFMKFHEHHLKLYKRRHQLLPQALEKIQIYSK